MRNNYMLLLALLSLMVINKTAAYDFQKGSKGQVMWSLNCDFYGNDISNVQSAATACGDICAGNSKCTHFTWANNVCYMKSALNPTQLNYLNGAVCGWVNSRAHIQYGIRNGWVPMRGVNLGGWLVVENWINPNDALWSGVSSSIASGGEMVTMKALGHAVGDARFQNHWNTFITEQDIANLASYSLNTVRVPVGWWIIGYDNHDPSNQQAWKTFAPGGLAYLDRLINTWAIKYNVAVLVDIHSAKGSQNGDDHSAPPVPGTIYWDKYQENIDSTVEAARFLADRYKNVPSFLGLELLNEPKCDAGKLKQYYTTAYNVIRATGNNCLLITSPLLWEQNQGTANNWENFLRAPNVRHDFHKYLIWGYEGKSADWLMNQGVQAVAGDITSWTGNPLIIGEWSLAAPGSAGFTDATLKQYANNMITKGLGAASGWTFWTWKQGYGSRGNGWCMRDLFRDCFIDPKLWDSTSTKCP